VILARINWALPWSRVSLLVLGQVTGTLELLVTSRFTASFGGKLSSRGRALAAGHGAENGLVLFGFLTQGSLETHGFLAIFLELNWETGGDRDSFTVLLDSNEFCWTTVLCKTTVKSDFITTESEIVSK
jgi:hypothetical protein